MGRKKNGNNDDYDDSDDNIYYSPREPRLPAGCSACGNPAYPDCKSSCPMFDD